MNSGRFCAQPGRAVIACVMRAIHPDWAAMGDASRTHPAKMRSGGGRADCTDIVKE
jgi:hypothetical protein